MQRKFTCKSDIWSFAVTLWEILTFARDRPLGRLTDEQVVKNFAHHYQNDGHEVYPPPPANCPREIYDLMMECWNVDEAQRPTFREIHMFLQRKNMGYNPREERLNGVDTTVGGWDEKPSNLDVATTGQTSKRERASNLVASARGDNRPTKLDVVIVHRNDRPNDPDAFGRSGTPVGV